MNKTILITGVVVLVVIVGGIFLLPKLSLGPDESTTTPTQWSQAGDYKIQKVSDPTDSTIVRTMILNEKAGFSFKVPAGWRVEGAEGISVDEYFINMFSPDAKLDSNNILLTQGCAISLNRFVQEDLWSSWNSAILRKQGDPNAGREEEEVITIDNSLALKSMLVAETQQAREKFGDSTQIRIPTSNFGVIEFGMTIMPQRKSDCVEEFDTFLSSFSID